MRRNVDARELHAFFAEHASDSAEALATGILEHVQSWSDKPFDDDVTLLIVGRV